MSGNRRQALAVVTSLTARVAERAQLAERRQHEVSA